MAKATFGAGCFWNVELAFAKTPGVISATSGYSGGRVDDPTYKQVCTDLTGHAEVVEVDFDPAQVSYEELLDVFFDIHDPTQLNRQGPDFGTQYRSAIFTHGDDQEKAARAAIEGWQARAKRPIVTQVEPAGPFWPAEEYHQRYLEKAGQSQCHIPSKEWLKD
ncbi:MAG: peptide-methionine (S)-S-oxide reductase MsrA [Actinomycetota bacterium]|nr:peptide-methionine (S)-S-oxide reductase MsrA [Actinomycetota bacterium]